MNSSTLPLYEDILHSLNYQVLIITLIIIFGILYRNRELKQEIKKREQVEKKLKESEEKFRTLFYIAPMLLSSFDNDGHYTLWNKECENVFGWTKDEINQHKNTLALFYPDPKDQIRITKAFNSSENCVYREGYPIAKSGKQLVTKRAKVILPNGELFDIGYDITELREIEEQKDEYTKQLKQAKDELAILNNSLQEKITSKVDELRKKDEILLKKAKMAAIGEVLTLIAHQWRQPLSSINSTIMGIDIKLQTDQFNFDDHNDRQRFLEYLGKKHQNINKYVDFLATTTDEFRNFFNPNKSQELVLLNTPILQALQIVQTYMQEKGITFDIELSEEIQCTLYQSEVMQVILNILKNCEDNFLEKNISNPKVFINVYENSDNYIIRICDNGGGIPEEIIDQIFDPYFSTKDEKNGTGLGLYMSKTIIEEHHNGTIFAQNIKDGVCFEIHFKKPLRDT